MKKVSAGRLTARYVAALSVVGILSILCHFVLSSEIRVNLSAAALINRSGRQRMLSQRMSSLGSQYALGDRTARAELVSATNDFEREHQLLLEEVGVGDGADSEDARLHAIYTEGLDAQTRAYLAAARRIASTPVSDPAFKGLLAAFNAQARSPLLNALNDVVVVQQTWSERRLASLQQFQWSILGLVLFTLLVEGFAVFRPMVRGIVNTTATLRRLAAFDSLTGTANRRKFIESATTEMHRARRYDRPISLLALDVDHFKSINDRHGHAAGDAALTALCTALRGGLRSADMIGRIGGEEFGILLPETSLNGAIIVGERLRASIAGLLVSHERSTMSFTVSIGVVQITDATTSLADAMKAADVLLHRAKQNGRNRVFSAIDLTLQLRDGGPSLWAPANDSGRLVH